MPQKKEVKVRDMKPKKDAKGGKATAKRSLEGRTTAGRSLAGRSGAGNKNR